MAHGGKGLNITINPSRTKETADGEMKSQASDAGEGREASWAGGVLHGTREAHQVTLASGNSVQTSWSWIYLYVVSQC